MPVPNTANRIVQWMRDSIEAVSSEMTIENYPTVLSRGARTFRTTCRLTVGPEKHAGRPSAIVAVRLKDGLWQQRATPIAWGIPRVDKIEHYSLAVIRARVSIHRWTKGTGKARTMFFRVGTNGAVAIMPNNDKIIVADPPTPSVPSTHVATFVPLNGHLVEQRTANPDRAAWDLWEAEVVAARKIISALVHAAGEPIDAATIASHSQSRCDHCGRWAREHIGERWRRHPKSVYWCERCAMSAAETMGDLLK